MTGPDPTSSPPADDLLAAAESIDTGRPAAAPAPAPGPAERSADLQREAVEAVQVMAAFVLPALTLFPIGARLAGCYGPPELDKIGGALGGWCEARDVSIGEWMARWAPELMLVASLVGPAMPVIVEWAKAKHAAGQVIEGATAPTAPGAEPAPPPEDGRF